MRKSQIGNPLADDRRTELLDKLEALGASPLNQCKGPNDSALDFYRLNGQVIIIQWYAPQFGGYEVYAPVFNGNEVKGTFEALDDMAKARYATR